MGPTTVIIVDDDESPGVDVSPTVVRLNEGDSGDYEVVLKTEPSGKVTIGIAITSGEGVTVGADSLTFTPDDNNWKTPQVVAVTAEPDSDTQDEQVTISHTVKEGSASEYLSVTIPSVTVEVTDGDEAGVIVWPTELAVVEGLAGFSDFYEVSLASAPLADVTIGIMTSEGEVTTTPVSLTFTPVNYATKQPVAVRAGRDDDSENDKVVISHESTSTDEKDNGLGIDNVEVTVYDTNRPGSVDVLPEALWIMEGEEGDTYTVTLGTRPYADVNITVTAGEEVTAMPSILTFTPTDWDEGQTEQTVMVSADLDEDTEDEFVTITHTVDTDDINYGNVEPGSVHVTVYDIHAEVSVAISPTSLWIEEGQSGFSGAYTVRLRTQPSASVAIHMTVGGEVTASPSGLTFTPNTWNTPQTVMVSADHDEDTEDDRETITHTAVSADVNYNGLEGIDSVAVTVYDDDVPAAVAISPSALWIDEGLPGFSDYYTVRLKTQPTANVTIAITAGEEVTASPSRLTFTPTDWGTERTVAVSAGHDQDSEDDSVTITHAATSADGNYNGLEIDSVAVTVYDDDASASVAISPSVLWIDEGRSGFSDNYTVRLRAQPTSNVTIAMTAGQEVTANPSRLTFTPTNWGREQTVTVSAAHDQDTEDDQVSITHTATSADGDYNGVGIDSVAVTVYDDDEPAPEPRAVVVPTESVPRQEAAKPTETPAPTPTAVPAPTPTPTLAPTPTATATPTPTPTATPAALQELGVPTLDEAEPRGRNLLEQAAAASRDRLALIIVLVIALILAGLTFVYLILRRR